VVEDQTLTILSSSHLLVPPHHGSSSHLLSPLLFLVDRRGRLKYPFFSALALLDPPRILAVVRLKTLVSLHTDPRPSFPQVPQDLSPVQVLIFEPLSLCFVSPSVFFSLLTPPKNRIFRVCLQLVQFLLRRFPVIYNLSGCFTFRGGSVLGSTQIDCLPRTTGLPFRTSSKKRSTSYCSFSLGISPTSRSALQLFSPHARLRFALCPHLPLPFLKSVYFRCIEKNPLRSLPCPIGYSSSPPMRRRSFGKTFFFNRPGQLCLSVDGPAIFLFLIFHTTIPFQPPSSEFFFSP